MKNRLGIVILKKSSFTIKSEFEVELLEVPHAAADVEELPGGLARVELDVVALNLAREPTGVFLW